MDTQPPPVAEAYRDPTAAEAAPDYEDASLGTLIKELRDETLMLFKQEAALIRTEVGEKVSQATRDAAKIPAGALIGYLGLVLLCIGLCFLLAWGLAALGIAYLLAQILSFVVLGLIITIVGVVLAKAGVNSLSHEDITPHQTIASVKETTQWAKEKAS